MAASFAQNLATLYANRYSIRVYSRRKIATCREAIMGVKPLSFAATLALSAALVLGGCKKAPPAEPASVPNSDGSTSQAAPPPAPAGASPPPPPPPPPEPVKLTAPAGAAGVVTVTEQLSASHNNVGDTF